jgi:hypothetical protein
MMKEKKSLAPPALFPQNPAEMIQSMTEKLMLNPCPSVFIRG